MQLRFDQNKEHLKLLVFCSHHKQQGGVFEHAWQIFREYPIPVKSHYECRKGHIVQKFGRRILLIGNN